MGLLSILSNLMAVVKAVFGVMQRRSLIKAGSDATLVELYREELRRARRAREIDEKPDLPDDDLIDKL